MSVRRRTWNTSRGEKKESWIVDYTDSDGDRHIRTFDRKKEANSFHAATRVEVGKGTHTAPSKSITVAQAANDWIAYVKLEGRERSTLDHYRQHAELHINPRLGRESLAKLTTPRVNAFRDNLLASMSRPMAKKVLASLKSLLGDAQRRGNVAQNVATNVKIAINEREARKLKISVDIPTPSEIRRIINAATGPLRPLVVTAVFTGLRASELRGLRWVDIDLKRGRLHVHQRADAYNVIGKPKSSSGERVIPLGPLVMNTLREWRLACPRGDLGLAFPNGNGGIRRYLSLRNQVADLLVEADVTTKDGDPKYTGLHWMRHFYASWCINRRADGGLELPAKVVQARLGHASIVMTMDRYGHLFPSDDDGSELAGAEAALMG